MSEFVSVKNVARDLVDFRIVGLVGSFSNDGGEGNENGKKAMV